jgi:hypothetical protein
MRADRRSDKVTRQSLHHLTNPTTVRLRVFGPAPRGACCLHCYRSGGEVLRIANAVALGSKPETLHERCALQWFNNMKRW